MADLIQYLKVVLIVQLFYAFSITMIVYALPAASLADIAKFQQPTETFSEKYIADQVGESVEQQFDLPVVELAALVFYSGDIVLDLIVNFATAVPSMFTLLIEAFLLFINLDATLAFNIKLFFWIMISMLYFISVVTFLLNLRARGTII